MAVDVGGACRCCCVHTNEPLALDVGYGLHRYITSPHTMACYLLVGSKIVRVLTFEVHFIHVATLTVSVCVCESQCVRGSLGVLYLKGEQVLVQSWLTGMLRPLSASCMQQDNVCSYVLCIINSTCGFCCIFRILVS